MNGRYTPTAALSVSETTRILMTGRVTSNRCITMDYKSARTENRMESTARRYVEQADAIAGRHETAVAVAKPLEVADEDLGCDPYNNTGQFKRSVR